VFGVMRVGGPPRTGIVEIADWPLELSLSANIVPSKDSTWSLFKRVA
jgi:hypothetical protein